jgi:hypothetical protein
MPYPGDIAVLVAVVLLLTWLVCRLLGIALPWD